MREPTTSSMTSSLCSLGIGRSNRVGTRECGMASECAALPSRGKMNSWNQNVPQTRAEQKNPFHLDNYTYFNKINSINSLDAMMVHFCNRSKEDSVGKESDMTCRYRCSPY